MYPPVTQRKLLWKETVESSKQIIYSHPHPHFRDWDLWRYIGDKGTSPRVVEAPERNTVLTGAHAPQGRTGSEAEKGRSSSPSRVGLYARNATKWGVGSPRVVETSGTWRPPLRLPPSFLWYHHTYITTKLYSCKITTVLVLCNLSILQYKRNCTEKTNFS